jgi:cellulose synthase (UDP-forming)
MSEKTRDSIIPYVLGASGILSIVYFLHWWAEDGRWRSPALLLVLAAALVYIFVQMVFSWILNLAAQKPDRREPYDGKRTVDIYVTACNEPVDLVHHALSAALALRGSKRVWLLDDGGDLELHDLAARLGCGYLTRTDRQHAKAGNMNAALGNTGAEIIAIFDIDHAPRPDFLEKSLGYFDDPKMGFVQVMLTFYNFNESWVARSAMESSLEFYNPTYLGAHRLGAATLMGSNALIRRSALASIGGYRPGLAEDLATSIALHAAGWHSAYVAEPLAPGLSPSSLAAWSVQQLKWARGVFELLLTALPRCLGRLTWGQRISYAVRMTKYWIGPAVFVHLAATILMLFFGDAPARGAFHSYLLHLGPLLVVDACVRAYALQRHRHPSLPPSSLLGAVILVYGSWPIYLIAWTLALFRRPLSFRPTPKDRGNRLNAAWLLPQFFALVMLTAGAWFTIAVLNHPVSLLLGFSIAQAAIQLFLLVKWVQADLFGVENKTQPQTGAVMER